MVSTIKVRKHGATSRKKNNTSRAVSVKNSGVMLFVAGLLVGGVGMFAILNMLGTTKKPSTIKIAKTNKVSTRDNVKVSSSKKNNSYDFYTILPSSSDTKHKKPGNVSNKDTHYLVQGGSYIHLKDADELKARLALMGIESKIETAKIRSGSNRYRVLIGPFTTENLAMTMQRNLKELNIYDSLILKRTT